MAFNGSRSSGSRGGFRGGRDFDKPQMHQAVCDKCRKDCEVPFRPTSGKPVFCNNCFDRPQFSRPGGNFERSNFADKRMFDAVCDECKNNCQVPFQPRGDKPIYCSNCFGNKGGRDRGSNVENPQAKYEEQFALLNSKLDRVLNILIPVVAEVEAEEVVEEVLEDEEKAPKKSTKKKK